MKLLLPAIKSALQGISLLAATADCYITPDEDWRPDGTGNTSLGIYPDEVSRESTVGDEVEMEATVRIIACVPMTNSSDMLCGSSGAYALLEAVTTILKNNSLSLAGWEGVTVGNDSPATTKPAPAGESILTLASVSRSFVYTIIRTT